MAISIVCLNCGSQEVQRDHQTGELVCQVCGSVAEESRIISEVSFSESATGKALVTGQYVSQDSAGVLNNSLYGMQAGESRQQTLEKARNRMDKIASRLNIPDHVVENAQRVFRSALSSNFVKGRKSQHVLSACLYLACRISQTDHMLMDFAELIHVNVFNIGSTYLQLVRSEKIAKLPIVDPTVFIQRFTSRLQFGMEGSKRVVNDARLLVQRMGKDWLQQGRRPAGVAAACILLAARMNNFRRSKAELVQVAKIAEETLQRRLDEFRHTSAGTLSIQDFRSTNVESAADPPSFTRNRELEKLMAEQLARDEERREQGENPPDPYLDDKMVTMAKELDQVDGETIKLTAEVEALLNDPGLVDAAKHVAADPEAQRARALRDDRLLGKLETPEPAFDEGDEADGADGDVDIDAAAAVAAEEDLENAFETAVSSGIKGRTQLYLEGFRKRREERLQKEREAAAARERLAAETAAAAAADDPESLSDVDDDEVDFVILTEEEIELKSKVWMSINREYLLEQERKRLRQEADEAAGIVKPARKKRKPRAKPATDVEGGSAEANASNMLREKAPSKKINYAAVRDLFSKPSGAATPAGN